MRLFTFGTAAMAAALLFAPVASAQNDVTAGKQAATEEKLAQLTEKLSDPAMQDSVATMVERMTGAMMQLPVGKFAAAIEDARPGSVKKKIPEDATIADLAGDKADDAPEMLGKHSRIAMGMMAGLAKAFADLLPEFQAIAKEMPRK